MPSQVRLPIAVATVLLCACTRRPAPTLVWEGTSGPRVESASAVAGRLTDAAPGVRRGGWGDAEDATMQLLETDRPEDPHVHERHDLTVVLLEGRGTVIVEGRRHPMRAGDVVHVGRGAVHALQPEGKVIGLAIFTPRLERADYRPRPMPEAEKNRE